jgi:hypothetical protein
LVLTELEYEKQCSNVRLEGEVGDGKCIIE